MNISDETANERGSHVFGADFRFHKMRKILVVVLFHRTLCILVTYSTLDSIYFVLHSDAGAKHFNDALTSLAIGN